MRPYSNDLRSLVVAAMDVGGSCRAVAAIFEEAPARQLWRAAQADLDFTSLVFVDETSTNTAMTRTHGWGQKGKQLAGYAPHGRWMTSAFLAGLTHDTLLAPQLLPCPMTGVIFQQWLEECLIPEMQPGSIPGLRRGRLYSPGFNPIDQLFAKIKTLL